jgi:hypothetical protein
MRRCNKVRGKSWWNEENQHAKAVNLRLHILVADPPPALMDKPLDDVEHLRTAGVAFQGSTFNKLKSDPAVQAFFLYRYVRTSPFLEHTTYDAVLRPV